MNVIRKDEYGAYLTAYDLMGSLLDHVKIKEECKKAKIIPDDFKDEKSMRYEVGWKCSQCGESWRISVRRLRNTLGDKRIREFGRSENMMFLSDLQKVMKR